MRCPRGKKRGAVNSTFSKHRPSSPLVSGKLPRSRVRRVENQIPSIRAVTLHRDTAIHRPITANRIIRALASSSREAETDSACQALSVKTPLTDTSRRETRTYSARGNLQTKDLPAKSPSWRVAKGITTQIALSSNAFKQSVKKLRRKIFQSIGNPESSGQTSSPPGHIRMKSHIQFLTTPSADTPGTALLLHFNEKRYLFGNIHEGLQRAGIESGAKFSKVTDIFLTGRTEWKTTGGLFGLILTLADAAMASTNAAREILRQKRERLYERQQQGEVISRKEASNQNDVKTTKPTLSIHGGANLTHLFATARSFIFRKSMPIRVFEHQTDGHGVDVADRKPDYVDDCIQAWTLPISPSRSDEEVGSRPGSRKRSHTEYSESSFPANLFLGDETPQGDKQADQDLRKYVVSEMFESSWRMDDLEERPLSELPPGFKAFIRNPETNRLERYQIPPKNSETPMPEINVLVRKAWPGALIEELPTSKPSTVALSYIVRNHYQRGKFQPQKAIELGVLDRTQYAKLAAGEDVKSQNGKTVRPDMVLAEGKEGGGVAIVDLPDTDYVESLVQRSEWHDPKIMNGVGGFLWLLGPGVANDSRLQEFINRHHTLQHIISSPDECSNHLVFTSSAKSSVRLSQVDPRHFPIPIHNNSSSSTSNFQAPNVTFARPGQSLQLEPKVEKQDGSISPLLDTAMVLQSTTKEVLRLAREARAEIQQANEAKTSTNRCLPSEDAEITCLGTGSALPSKYRNVSGTLLRVHGCGSYLLDCGENTLGQLKRVYDPATLKEILRDLKLIWISHLHADHHLGTVAMIKAWYEEVHGSPDASATSNTPILDEFMQPEKVFVGPGKLCVVGGSLMIKWLREYASVEDYGHSKILPLASHTTRERKSRSFLEWNSQKLSMVPGSSDSISRALRAATGLENLQACGVSHCYDAQAVALTFPTGLKVSYSGDCRPSKAFADIGKGSTVLIHEATFDDELKGDAEAKKHSTTSEAIGVGLAMGAQRVILTHFSQRYQKIPVMESVEVDNVMLEEADEQDQDVPIASEDAAKIPPNDQVPDGEVEQSANAEQTSEEDAVAATQDDQTHVRVGQLASASWSIYRGEAMADDPSRKPASPRREAELSEGGQAAPGVGHGPSVVPIAPSAAKDMKICVAFDYMKVRVGDIEHMEKLTPALVELYQTTYDDEGYDKEYVESAETEAGEANRVGKANGDKKSNEEINRGKSKKSKVDVGKDIPIEQAKVLKDKASEVEAEVQVSPETKMVESSLDENMPEAAVRTRHSPETEKVGASLNGKAPEDGSQLQHFPEMTIQQDLGDGAATDLVSDPEETSGSRRTPLTSISISMTTQARPSQRPDPDEEQEDSQKLPDGVRFLDYKYIAAKGVTNPQEDQPTTDRFTQTDQARSSRRLDREDKVSVKTCQDGTWERQGNEEKMLGLADPTQHSEILDCGKEIVKQTSILSARLIGNLRYNNMLRKATLQGDIHEVFKPTILTGLSELKILLNRYTWAFRHSGRLKLLRDTLYKRGYRPDSTATREDKTITTEDATSQREKQPPPMCSVSIDEDCNNRLPVSYEEQRIAKLSQSDATSVPFSAQEDTATAQPDDPPIQKTVSSHLAMTNEVQPSEVADIKSHVQFLTRRIARKYAVTGHRLEIVSTAITNGHLPDKIIARIQRDLVELDASIRKFGNHYRRKQKSLKDALDQHGYPTRPPRSDRKAEREIRSTCRVVRFSGQPPYTSISPGDYKKEAS